MIFNSLSSPGATYLIRFQSNKLEVEMWSAKSVSSLHESLEYVSSSINQEGHHVCK